MVKRISTGVFELDSMLDGGVPEGFFVAVVGEPGTGKSVLSMRFIHQGLVEGSGGIYVTTEQDRGSIVEQAKTFGWDWEPFLGRGLIIIDALEPKSTDPWSLPEMDIEHMISKVIEAKKHLGYRPARLVVDSISAFWLDKPALARKYSYTVKRILGKWNLTAYLVSQYAITTAMAFGWGVEHIADGIFRFRRRIVRGELKRYFIIEKMRHTNHDTRMYEIDIKPGRGIVFVKPVEDIDIYDMEREYRIH